MKQMTTCENCGTEHGAGIHFCTQCGRVLPDKNKGTPIHPENVGQVFSNFAKGDLFGAAFSAKPGTFEVNETRPQTPPLSSSGSTRGRRATRADVIKTVARAAAIGIAKSVALSIAVLGPGFVMLMMGMTIPGMIWLFVGSFTMMAWTYRKPWRLGMIACLIPPAAAAACYLVQLMIFGGAVPPLMFLAGAILAGTAVGFWRAQTHNVTRAEDGGIIAERTIGYLLVWVAAYAGTQLLGFVATSALAVRAGLLSGAFTTAMLVMVSLIVWRKFRHLRQVAVIASFVIAGWAIQPVSNVFAQGSPCSGMFLDAGGNIMKLSRACGSAAGNGITDRALLVLLSYETSRVSDVASLMVQADRAKSRGGAANVRVALDLYIRAFNTENKKNLPSRRQIGMALVNLANANYTPEIGAIATQYAIATTRLELEYCSIQERGYANLPKYKREYNNARQCAANAKAALARAGQTAQPQPNPPANPPANPQANPQANPPANPPRTPPSPPPFDPPTPEEIAAVAAAVTAALIAAGVAVNVAQAIAIAIANAMQAGVQLSAEEIQRAISDALMEMLGRGTDADAEGAGNAPPNVAFSDRFRPPSRAAGDPEPETATGAEPEPEPVAQQDAPEPKPEPARHTQSEDDPQPETRAETEEDRRRRQIENGIRNTLAAMPSSARRQDLEAELRDAAASQSPVWLEELWNHLREQRQAQVNEAADDGWWDENLWSPLHGAGESAAVAARETGKVAGAFGLGMVTGGSATVVQGVAATILGSSALVGIGAVEGGLEAKNGDVTFDSWKAGKGAARGALDAGGALVGGVAANGSKVIVAAKTVFAGTSTYGRTYADAFEQTGDRELAHERAKWAAGAEAAKTLGGEMFDEYTRKTGQKGEAQKVDGTAGDHAPGDASVTAIIDGRTQANETRITVAKTTANVVGRTLGNIASSEEDLTTAEAGRQAIKSEAHELAVSHTLSGVDAGGGADELTSAQRAVISRLEAERAGTAPRAPISTDYAAHLNASGGVPDHYVPGDDTLPGNGNFTADAQRHVQAVADSHGVKIIARTVDAEGSAAVARGDAHAKPPTMKANTGNDADVLLGMDPAHMNRVVVFSPEMPDRATARNADGSPLSDAQWDALGKRHKLRQELHAEYSQAIPAGDEFTMDGQLVRNRATGLPYAGDMDVFGVVGMHGEPLPAAVSNQVMTDLISAEGRPGKTSGSTVTHNDHMSWNIAALDNTTIGHDGKTDRQRAIDINASILARVQPGGQQMAEFAARPGMAPPRAAGTHYQGPGPKTE
ncbi:MAG: hypothetical protein ABIL01_14060 [Pseudomonadota bacterium]